ncbi:hypothetical protein ABEB36_006435 [Hypothenemus hampei]|uniref:Uncharacterized protein n=1 Tax=Hypothenemus hampei TaxID=57062 RepID=A0ABD1EQI5_HYPHA
MSYNNHSNQLNHNNDAFYRSRGMSGRPDDWENNSSFWGQSPPSRAELDNRANQLNPNNPRYYSSRGNEDGAEYKGGHSASSCTLI